MPADSVNDLLLHRLDAAGATVATPAGVGARTALGLAATAETSRGRGAPAPTVAVRGFFLTAKADDAGPHLLLYAIAGRLFVRYEWTREAVMTVAVPLSRVACVIAQSAAAGASLHIEFDAMPSATTAESLARTGPDPDSMDDESITRSRHMWRTEPGHYALSAGTGDPAALAELEVFGAALRAAMSS